MSTSCLVDKLSYYVDLAPAEVRLLAQLEEVERRFAAQEEIHGTGEEEDRLHVVKKGWLYTYVDMPDGRRQIVRVQHPGDIVGFPDIAFTYATTTLRASEDVVLCPFPKANLDDIFVNSPRLTALLFALANRDMACVVDTIRALGRMSARERLTYFLLDLIARLRITNKSITDTIRLPLTQTEIGDALGLTHTYVSKSLGAMEDDGLIRRAGQSVTLLKEEALRTSIDFIDRYKTLDTKWFPSG